MPPKKRKLINLTSDDEQDAPFDLQRAILALCRPKHLDSMMRHVDDLIDGFVSTMHPDALRVARRYSRLRSAPGRRARWLSRHSQAFRTRGCLWQTASSGTAGSTRCSTACSSGVPACVCRNNTGTCAGAGRSASAPCPRAPPPCSTVCPGTGWCPPSSRGEGAGLAFKAWGTRFLESGHPEESKSAFIWGFVPRFAL